MKKYKWYIIGIIALVLAEVSLVGGIGVWREYFWAAVEKRQLHDFFILLSYFAGAALGACLISGYTQYLISYVSLLLRTELTAISLELKHSKVEGREQRIQEDCFSYPLLAIGLLVGLLRSFLILGTFIVIVTVQVGVSYILLPILYVLIGTGLAFKLDKPLINLNYLNQRFEAGLRKTLFLKEESAIVKAYHKVRDNNLDIFITTKKLAYFQSFYNQVTVIVPYVLLFAVYFSGKIAFGVFMQVASSMAHIIDSMSYLINSFNDINKFLSCKKRLKEMGVI